MFSELKDQQPLAFKIYDGREKNYLFGLNHRLDDMIYTSPLGLSEKISLAIQANEVTFDQAEQIKLVLTDENGLELYSEEKLQKYLYNIRQVLEIVAEDPQLLFKPDPEAQSRLADSLQFAADMVKNYIEGKPARDSEVIHAQDFLVTRLTAELAKLKEIFVDYPYLLAPMIEVNEKVLEAVKQLSPELKKNRGVLIDIFNLSNGIISLTVELTEAKVDQEKLKAVLEMVASL
jgi:hypothetical protein